MLKHTNHVECSQRHTYNSLKQLNYEDTPGLSKVELTRSKESAFLKRPWK